MLGGGLDDVRGEVVAAEVAVPVDPAVLRRDDERRVARDQVVRLVSRRIEEAAVPAFDVVEAVERSIERGVRKRARVHVDGDDVLVVARGEQRVDAAARPDVERARAALARRQDVARARRRRVARDIVGRVVRVPREAVRREQHVVDRHDPRLRHDLAARSSARPVAASASTACGPSAVDRVHLRHGQLQEEQPHRRRQLRLRQAPLGDEHLLPAAGEGVLVEQLARASPRGSRAGAGLRRVPRPRRDREWESPPGAIMSHPAAAPTFEATATPSSRAG